MSTTDPTSPDYDPEGEAQRPSPPPPPSGSGSTAYPPPNQSAEASPPSSGAPAYPSYGPPSPPPVADAPAYPGYAPTSGSPAPGTSPYAAPPPPAYGAPPGNPYGAPAAQVALPGGGQVPPMTTRLLARIVDWVIMGIVYTIVMFIGFAGLFGTSGSDGEPSGLALGAFFVMMLVLTVIGIVYEVVLIALRGATIGKQVMGIKVVMQDNGAIPGWGPSLIRWGIPAIANFICGLGIVIYLSPFWADPTGRQRGYHDLAANTVVVSAR